MKNSDQRMANELAGSMWSHNYGPLIFLRMGLVWERPTNA